MRLQARNDFYHLVHIYLISFSVTKKFFFFCLFFFFFGARIKTSKMSIIRKEIAEHCPVKLKFFPQAITFSANITKAHSTSFRCTMHGYIFWHSVKIYCINAFHFYYNVFQNCAHFNVPIFPSLGKISSS